jgi:hypothetical protein
LHTCRNYCRRTTVTLAYHCRQTPLLGAPLQSFPFLQGSDVGTPHFAGKSALQASFEGWTMRGSSGCDWCGSNQDRDSFGTLVRWFDVGWVLSIILVGRRRISFHPEVQEGGRSRSICQHMVGYSSEEDITSQGPFTQRTLSRAQTTDPHPMPENFIIFYISTSYNLPLFRAHQQQHVPPPQQSPQTPRPSEPSPPSPQPNAPHPSTSPSTSPSALYSTPPT